MSFTALNFRSLTAAAAAALMFSTSLAPAQANDVSISAEKAHPIMQTGNNAYVFKLSQQMQKDGVEKHAIYARGFAKKLESALAVGADAPRLVADPEKPFNGQLVISAVVPPKALYNTANIPVCVEGAVKDAAGNIQNTSQLIATYYITPKGEVVPYKFNGEIKTATQGFAFACRGPLVAARADMMKGTSQGEPPPSK